MTNDWRIILTDGDVLHRDETYYDVGPAGELKLYNKVRQGWNWVDVEGLCFAPGEWVSIESWDVDEEDEV